MAGGARLLTRGGKRILRADGTQAINNAADNGCCCCICSADGLSNYGKTLLVTFSGIVIPIGVCIGTSGGVSAQYTVADVNNTFCLNTVVLESSAGDCEYTFSDPGCTRLAWYDGCVYSLSRCGCFITAQTVPQTGAGLGTQVRVVMGGAWSVFDGGGSSLDILPCGGSITLPNRATYIDFATSAVVPFGGSVTISDTPC